MPQRFLPARRAASKLCSSTASEEPEDRVQGPASRRRGNSPPGAYISGEYTSWLEISVAPRVREPAAM